MPSEGEPADGVDAHVNARPANPLYGFGCAAAS